MLKSLNEACQNNEAGTSTEVSDPMPDFQQGSEQAFRFFVYKLAQICDNGIIPRGNTITSFAVLQPGAVEYVFASNRRTDKQLEETKHFVTSILTFVGKASISQVEKKRNLYRRIIGDVLLFNEQRLKSYIKGFLGSLKNCLNAIDEEDSESGRAEPNNGYRITTNGP